MLELLKKSGCTSLNIGLESINQEALDGCGKGFNKVKEFSECLKIIRESGITPTVNFMFGFEQDRKDVFAETLEFIDNNPVGWAHFMVLTPVPGSLLWDKLLTENRIFDQNWSHYDGMHVVFEPKNMTAEELERNYWNTHNEYLSYRRSLRRSISNGIRNFKDSWRFNMAARSKFKRNREALYF